ncbi:MAG: hypothetical protein LBB19_03250 [Puniceicoccales bacterium]|jgi:hypothetical protein|nr:hypothetical protein [Puniceicoccales bacterium]
MHKKSKWGVTFLEVTLCLLILGALIDCIARLLKQFPPLLTAKPGQFAELHAVIAPIIGTGKQIIWAHGILQVELANGWVHVVFQSQKLSQQPHARVLFLRIPPHYCIQWQRWHKHHKCWTPLEDQKTYKHLRFVKLVLSRSPDTIVEEFIFSTALEKCYT